MNWTKGYPMNNALNSFWRLLLVLALIAGSVSAGNVLFVVGNTTLGAGDARIKTLLESKGHVVTLKSGSASVTGDATGKILVVISSTVQSGDVNTKFRLVTVPVLNWEPNIMDDLGLTNGTSGEYGSITSMTQVQIGLASHQMAAGFNGGVAVYNGAGSKGTYAKPNANALKAATAVGDATLATIFGYEIGAGMFGLAAPARRVGFFLDDLTPADLNDNGVTLFHAACNWAMNVMQPAIAPNQHPVSTAVNVGQSASFSVTATGGALNYQWQKNGVNIAGATSSTYTTPVTVAADNGALFSVVVTNSAGSLTSGNAVLTVGNSSPVIVLQPRDRAVEEGQTAAFSVQAAGTGLSYQWKKGTVSDGGALVLSNISGATGSSHIIPPASLADHNSTYTCVVTNGSGSATSLSAKLLIVKTPFIAQTQYYEEVNSTVPSFRLGWNKDNQYAYFEQGGVEQLRLKDDYAHVPTKLYFGVGALVGFNWVPGLDNNVDTLSLGTGEDGTPQFNVFQVMRTPEGVEGIQFPMGFRFPSQIKLEGAVSWEVSGSADENGMVFERFLENPIDQSRRETHAYGSTGVGFTSIHTNSPSGGMDPFFALYSSTYDANALVLERYAGTSSADDTLAASTMINADFVSTDSVHSRMVRADTVIATHMVTTPKWRVARSLPDYVFDPDYALKSLEEVEAFTRANRHLPNLPSAREMAEKGINLAEMNIQLLKTVEELTLHLMALQKEVRVQKREMKKLTGKMQEYRQGKAVGK